MVEDLLAARGGIVSHQTVRLWAEKFGRTFANEIPRRSSGRLGEKWHLDEAVVSIRGKKHWLWRAVDQDGLVLDVLVQSRRNAKAAKRLMRNLLKGQGRSPWVMITDKLRSYGRSKARDHAGCRASLPQGVEQSGGEFSAASPAARADHEALQIAATSTTLRLHPRSDRQPVSHPAPRHNLRPSSRTARGGDEPVGEDCPTMRNMCGQRLSLALHPLSLRCRDRR